MTKDVGEAAAGGAEASRNRSEDAAILVICGEQALGAKAFYSAMEVIGYESITHKGTPHLHIKMDSHELMQQLSFVLENTYITMLMLAVESNPKEENLYVSKNFLNSTHEFLQSTTTSLMEKILEEEERLNDG